MLLSWLFFVVDIGGINICVGLVDENGLIEGIIECYRNVESGSFYEVVDVYMF